MLQVYENQEDLSAAAADLFVDQARKSIKDSGRFCVVLSGGSTPQRTYELLAEKPRRDQVEWKKVHVFWGDDRCVPASDPRNNARMARYALLDHVPIPGENIRAIPCSVTPMVAAEQYERVLETFFAGHRPRFDLIFLGLGEDGHTASLFPGSPVLEEQLHWVSDVYVPEQGLHRITLTAAVINQAAMVAFLVQGEGKAWVLRNMLEGEEDYRSLPARLIKPKDGELVWMVDRQAASLLSESA